MTIRRGSRSEVEGRQTGFSTACWAAPSRSVPGCDASRCMAKLPTLPNTAMPIGPASGRRCTR